MLLHSGWLTCNTHVIPKSPTVHPILALSIFDKSFLISAQLCSGDSGEAGDEAGSGGGGGSDSGGSGLEVV